MEKTEHQLETPQQSASSGMQSGYPEIAVIVGCGRSGTTYLRDILQQTLNIGFAGEARFVVPLYRQARRRKTFEQPANLHRLAARVVETVPFRHLRHGHGQACRTDELISRIKEPTYSGFLYAVFSLIAEKLGTERLGYKCPGDVWHLPLISQLLPSARFIHIIRDGRDVARSTLGFRWGPTNLYCASRYWAKAVSTGRRDGAQLSDRYLEVHFEDLVRGTGDAAASIARFVDSSISPAKVRELTTLIQHTRRLEVAQRWARDMEPRHQYLCESAAGDVLRACGYATYEKNPRISTLAASFYRGADFLSRSWNFLTRQVLKEGRM